jgi:hypothetical protein
LVYKTNPLQFFLSSSSADSSQQKIILSSHDSFDLTEENFIFAENINPNEENKKRIQFDLSFKISLGILFVCAFTVTIFVCVTRADEEKLEKEEIVGGDDEENNKTVLKFSSPEQNADHRQKNDHDNNSDDSFVISSSESDGDLEEENDNEDDLDLSSIEGTERSDWGFQEEEEENDEDFHFLRQLMAGNEDSQNELPENRIGFSSPDLLQVYNVPESDEETVEGDDHYKDRDVDNDNDDDMEKDENETAFEDDIRFLQRLFSS